MGADSEQNANDVPAPVFRSGALAEPVELRVVAALPLANGLEGASNTQRTQSDFIVVRDGVVVDCLWGSPDERNNLLWHTYALHPQTHPLPISRCVPRVVPLAVARTVARVLEVCGEHTSRDSSPAAPKTLDQAARVARFATLDFREAGAGGPKWRHVAYLMGQLCLLVNGVEAYTHREVVRHLPSLGPWLEVRGANVGGLDVLVQIRDQIMECLEPVYTRSEGGLTLFRYRNATSGAWNSYSLQARGTVIDLARLRCVVRPYDKFFQLGEIDGWGRDDLVGREPDEIVEKVDGSMVSLFRHEGCLRFVTKGSFDSAEARLAADIGRHYDLEALDTDRYDHVFEVVSDKLRYPEGFTCVAYPSDALVLIGMRQRSTGDTLSYQRVRAEGLRVGLPVPRSFEGSFADALQCCAEDEWRNAEGWVARFGDKRVKLKLRSYERTNRMINELKRDKSRLQKRYLRMSESERQLFGRGLPDVVRADLERWVVVPYRNGRAAVVEAVDEWLEHQSGREARDLMPVLRAEVAQQFHKVVFRRFRGESIDSYLDPALSWLCFDAPERLSEDWSVVDMSLDSDGPAIRSRGL